MKEMVGGCCVCADENGWTDNPLIYCDGENCEVAVHQGCYGIQEVPEGEWFCAKCTKSATMPPGSINEASFCCQLCPFDYGALKRTEDPHKWCHVICALYIPEVRFGNVHSMEPVILSDVPVDKFNKTCYICAEERPNDAKKGACMSCNKSTCKRSFHVTCAQRKGLLCEEGAISRNVKYCGYCENHLKKAINDPAIKVIPACPPVQRISKDQEKKHQKILLSAPPPPPPSQPQQIHPTTGKSHMLVDSLPRTNPLDERPTTNNTGIFAVPTPTTSFSPPLTTSSRSSVAPTPPLTNSKPSHPPPSTASAASVSSTTTSSSNMANGSSLGETTVGSHCLQQLQIQSAAAAAAATLQQNSLPQSVSNDLNGYPAASQLSSFMHEIPARNTTSVASLLPPGAADYHLNGNGDEEKTVKAVLTAPLTKAKRMRDSKNDLIDKSNKRPRAQQRVPPVLGSSTTSSSSGGSGGTVGKSASMQRLINLVAPVVSETVIDFQRDRVADRTAAERRAAAAQSQPSTSTTNGAPAVIQTAGVNNVGGSGSGDVLHANSNSINHLNSNAAASIPGTSNDVIVQNGTASTSNSSGGHSNRLNLPSFMEQLLERQWDQGSSLLMANAHFDVAQLLSCLFQLKAENSRLEDSLSGLRKRRDHLFALNARLGELNAQDALKRQQRDGLLLQHQHPDLVPKAELKPDGLLAPASIPLPANHVGHFDDAKSLKNLNNRKTVALTIPMSMPLSTAAAALTTTTASSGALSAIHSNRATPSTAGAPLAATPVLSNSNELAALSPDRVANQTHAALLNIYRSMPMDPNVAAQLSMMSNFQGQVNPTTLFSRLLAQPGIAAAVNMINGGLQPSAIPPTSATPNGK